MTTADNPANETITVTAREVFMTFLYLGCTSFGGPVAHIGYFRDLMVTRRKWLDERTYADLVALCQFLPGPSSSQVGFGIGLMMAGWRGGLAAWLGFTMPSAILMTGFAIGLITFGEGLPGSLLSGLKLVAVSVVGHAVWSMSKSLTPDWPRRSMAAIAAILLILYPLPLLQLGVIAAGAAAGWMLLPGDRSRDYDLPAFHFSPRLWFLIIAIILLFLLPVLVTLYPAEWLALADGFYRAGALVFGGGHVVLPLLKSAVVEPGWVSDAEFLAGYCAAQAIPGPLFTVSAFLGQATGIGPFGLTGAAVALVAIFAASFMMMVGVLPYWASLRQVASVRRSLDGVNAAVVGLLLAVLVNPIILSGITQPAEAVIALGGFAVLVMGWLNPLMVVGLIVATTMVTSAIL
jgi:chromate transporter